MLSFLRRNPRWLGAGLLLTFASSFGQTTFISLFAAEIQAAHGLSPGSWGSLYTGGTLAAAALLFARGSWADSVALSRLAPLVAIAFAASALGLAFAPGPVLLVIALFGLRFCGQGMMSHIAMTAMARWFAANRGRAISIAALGHSLGEMVLPTLAVLLAAAAGWRTVWMAVAALLVLVVAPLLAVLLARRRTPAGIVEAMETAGFAGRHWTRREAVRTPLALALVPGFLTPSFVGTALIFQQVHLAGLKGWTLAAMAPAYSLYAAVTVTVALASGWAADRFGPARLLPAFALPLGLSALVLGAFGGLWAWYAGLALMALSFGMTNVLWNALLAWLCGTRHLGSTRAAAVAVMVVASALGPGVTGLLIDAGIAFTAQCMAMGLWCLALAAAYVPLGRARPRLNFGLHDALGGESQHLTHEVAVGLLLNQLSYG